MQLGDRIRLETGELLLLEALPSPPLSKLVQRQIFCDRFSRKILDLSWEELLVEIEDQRRARLEALQGSKEKVPKKRASRKKPSPSPDLSLDPLDLDLDEEEFLILGFGKGG